MKEGLLERVRLLIIKGKKNRDDLLLRTHYLKEINSEFVLISSQSRFVYRRGF